MISILIDGTGYALPRRRLDNEELSTMVDTSDEWISSRTGIKSRYISSDEESLSSLAAKAAGEAIDCSETDIEDIDLVIAATSTADRNFPGCACEAAGALGIKNAVCFDVSAACSGFLYALHIAGKLMKSGEYANALIIGADALSRYLDWQDRSTCVLFGDGAGAVVLRRTETEEENGIIYSSLGSDGTGGDVLTCSSKDKLRMNGQSVFKFAIRQVPEAIEELIRKHGIRKDSIKKYILHQANLRIIDSIAKKIDEPVEKFAVNLDRVGNTSAASIPILLSELIKGGELSEGDTVLLAGFGAGLTWGAAVIRL